MKKAFIVVGPEASGNRYLGRLLVSAGCAGSGTHHQPFDKDNWNFELPEPYPEKVVLVRSFPHAKAWPDLVTLKRKFDHYGYETTVLILFRDPWVVQESQIKEGHVANREMAFAHYQRAYSLIFEDIEQGELDFRIVPYSSLGRREFREWLFQSLDLQPVNPERFQDGDLKYLTVWRNRGSRNS